MRHAKPGDRSLRNAPPRSSALSRASIAGAVWAAFTLLLVSIRPPLASAQSSLFLTSAPGWAHYLCDGSEPDPNGSIVTQGLHCYSSLTVPAGATLTVSNNLSSATESQDSPRGALLAFVNGPCTLLGAINASATNTGYANGGGAGGGGGGAATSGAGQPGLPTTLFGTGAAITAAPGGAGGAAGRAGVAGVTPTIATQKYIWNLAATLGVLGGAAGGAGGMSGGTAALGGSGGGGVILVCKSIDFEGSINVSGGGGAAGTLGSGGGGGGGGGVVMMAASDYLANSGVINLGGGPGAPGDSGAGAGASGGAGWSKQFTF